MRNLASVQRIVDIQPIPKYDRVEYATVLGWHVIVKKDEFKVGDLCVYFEIDSKVPEIEAFEFLRPRGFKVKTLKMCGVVSQGLALSVDAFSQLKNVKEGDDVTDILNVKKYDPEGEKEAMLLEQKAAMEKNKLKRFLMKHKWYRVLFGGQKKKGGFPSWIKRTDETRIQTMPWLFNEKVNRTYLVTEKVDGTSTTWFHVAKKGFFGKEIFGVCSRNVYLKNRDGSIYWKMAIELNIQNVLSRIAREFKARTVVLQGECIGPGICGDKYQIGEKFYAFNLLVDGKPMTTLEMAEVLKTFGIVTVPILNKEFTLPANGDEMVAYANGKSVLNPSVLREGVVVRSYDKQVSFKAVSPDWLLKFKE